VLTLADGQLASSSKVELSLTGMADEEAQVAHLFQDDKWLFGSTTVEILTGETIQIGLWRLALDKEGLPAQGSVTKAFLSASETTVTGVLPSLQNDLMHLIISQLDSEQIYVIFDFATGSVQSAFHLTTSLQQGPFMNLLAHTSPDMTTHVQALMVSTQRTDAQFLFSAIIDEEEAGCQSDFLLDSMHIEFMLQEALTFEVLHQLSSDENTVQATQTRTTRRLFYDEEGNDSSAPNLGNVRILADSDDEKREL
jgi:hypothetical protein